MCKRERESESDVCMCHRERESVCVCVCVCVLCARVYVCGLIRGASVCRSVWIHDHLLRTELNTDAFHSPPGNINKSASAS